MDLVSLYKTEMQAKNSQYDFLAKVIIIGDSGVGKTNILTKYCTGVFKDSYVATIGVDFKLKTVSVEGSKIKLQIWDTAGQQRYRNITQTYFKGASGIILAYSINSRQSYKSISTWLRQIESNSQQNVSKILVGTKSDLQKDREVSYDEGRELGQKHGMLFLQASSKNGSNIEQIFTSLALQMKKHRAASSKDQTASMSLSKKQITNKNCSC